jgi:hypothetical protein
MELIILVIASILLLSNIVIQFAMANFTDKQLVRILKREEAIMAFILKEYEDGKPAEVEAAPEPALVVKVEPPKETAPTLSEKEIAKRKAFGERSKERHRLEREAKEARAAASGT